MNVAGAAAVVVLGVLGALGWLLAPIWNRPRVEAPPIPPAAVAGRVDFGARRPRRALTTGETVRVIVGIIGALLVSSVVAYVYALATVGFNFQD